MRVHVRGVSARRFMVKRRRDSAAHVIYEDVLVFIALLSEAYILCTDAHHCPRDRARTNHATEYIRHPRFMLPLMRDNRAPAQMAHSNYPDCVQ